MVREKDGVETLGELNEKQPTLLLLETHSTRYQMGEMAGTGREEKRVEEKPCAFSRKNIEWSIRTI